MSDNVLQWKGINSVLEPSFVDYEDIKDVNLSINAARKALYDLTVTLEVYEKKYRRLQYEYDTMLRRCVLDSDRSSVVDRKLDGEVKCQKIEMKVFIAKTHVDEIRRAIEYARQELQALQTISNNLRQQMKVI